MAFKKRSDVLLSLAALVALVASAVLTTPSAGTPAARFGQVLAFNSSEQRVLPVQRLALEATAAASFALAAANNRAALVDPLHSELKIVDTTSGVEVMSRRLEAVPSVVGIDEWGSFAVVGYSQRADLSIIGLEDSSRDRNISLPSPPGILRASRTIQKVLATLPKMNALAVVDIRTGANVQISVDRGPSGLALDPASNRALVSNYEDGTLSIIDLLDNTVIASVPIGLRPTDVVVDSGSRIAYVACAGSGLIERFDLVRLAPLGSLNAEAIKGLSHLALFPEIPRGKVRALLVASGLEEALTVFNVAQNTSWRIETGDEISELMPSGLTGEVVGFTNRSEVVAWDLRQLSPPVLMLAEPVSSKTDEQRELVLHGHNFLPNPGGKSALFKVLVGDAPAPSAQVLDDLTARLSWQGKLRRIPIQVITANGESNTVFLHDPDLAPRVSSLTPKAGPENGGTSCTIKGENFLDGSPGATTVFFGISPATDVVIVDETTITCTAPAGTDKVNVKVQNDQGVSLQSGDYIYLGPELSISDATVTEGNSGTVNAIFTVTLSPASALTVTVDYTTTDGTAICDGVDFNGTSGTLTFAPGVTSQNISIAIIGETLVEPNETFTVDLSNPINATILDGQGLGTIINDDGSSSLSITDASVIEGDSGTVAMSFTIVLSPASASSVTVNYATANDTATAPSDYASTSGGVGFLPGETTKVVTVLVNGDALYEQDETFFVNLSGATGAPISDSQGVGTIVSDDFPVLTINDVSVSEGNTGTTNADFTVTLSQPAVMTVSVNFTTLAGSAVGGSDYVDQTGSLTFLPGATTQTITVLVNGDTSNEPTETFYVHLSSASEATIGDNQGTGTIVDDDAPPTLSINDVSVTEGDTGTVNATFTVSLSAISAQTVTVAKATADNTATAGIDYDSGSGTLVFQPGETNQTFVVVVNGDTLNELNETFFVNLSSPTNATISDAQGVGTITNDDPLPNLAINDASVAEGDTGTASLTFTVTLSAASGQTVTVNYATANGTATSGSDYVSNSGTLTFSPGTTTQTVSITVNGDTIDEVSEDFFVNLTIPTNATISDSQGIGTILDDDLPSTISIDDVSVPEGNTGTANAVFTVSLSGPSGLSVTVNYATADGTATAGSDYVTKTGTLTFSPGTTSQTVTILVNGDTLNEPSETFFVNLSSPTNATISDSQGIGTITDDDGTPSLSINDVSLVEGNTGSSNAIFTVTLSAASGQTVTVSYATADGTAVTPTDYVSQAGSLTFSPGSTSQTLTILVNGDTLSEANETFFVNLSSPANATISDSQGVGTINNDDGTPSLSINDVTIPEGNSGTSNAVFTISLSAASGQTVTVNYATVDGTATAGSDYVAGSGTLTFNPGSTSQTVTVLVNGDAVSEPDETFNINLSGPTNATISDGQGIGIITNDDGVPALSIDDISLAEGSTGTTNAVFTVTLSAASGQTVTVNFATADGTALAASDYVAKTGLLTFSPGSTIQNITVAVNGDTLNEADETFFVNLSTPTNATISDSQGVGTITNDDGVPALSINDVSLSEGNSGTSNAVFTVTLSAASGQIVTVNYTTANGMAVAPGDYLTTSGILTFSPGSTTQNITVAVSGDTVNEPDETFFVNLSSPTNATIADSQGVATITNDDGQPALSIDDVSMLEGDTGTKNFLFTVTLSAASGQTVTVNYATGNGTAVAPGDYATKSGTLTFSPGNTIQNIAVAVTGDILNEPNETFFVNLSSATNATIADSQGVGTITNDDGVPFLSIDDVSVSEGNSGITNAVFTVTLSAASGQTVTVNYATADGTAVAPGDYVTKSGTLTFSPGGTIQNITIAVNGDTLNEPNETFFVNLSGATNATISDTQGQGTITNDDGLPALSINDATVTEGNSGAANAVFTVTLSFSSGQTVTVNYATADGTASAGSDYTGASGTLTFSPGSTIQNIAIPIIGDLVSEPDEAFLVNLTNPVNAAMSDNQGVGTILDDDAPPSLSIDDATVTEGNSGTTNAVFTVTLSSSSANPVTVSFATANGTATAGSDYIANSGTLTFAPGSTIQNITVAVLGDTLDEPNETFQINLSSPTNAVISDGQGLGTILDDDALPALSINDTTVVEGNSATVNAVLAVALSSASASQITVNYATASGTATAGTDYVAVSGTLTFPPGSTIQNITVPVNGDTLFEPNETFTVSLSNPVNATITDGLGLVTILDDDLGGTLQFSSAGYTAGEGSGSATIIVTRTGGEAGGVEVNYATSDGTAAAGADYSATAGTLLFAPGETSKTFTVAIIDDALFEASETVNLALSNPTGGASLGTINAAVLTITDNDPATAGALQFSAARYSAGENAGSAIVTVIRAGSTDAAASVNYATSNGTALAGADYTGSFGTLSFAAGETSKTFAVPILDDPLVEGNETVNLSLTAPSAGASLGSPASAVLTILDNDNPAPIISGMSPNFGEPAGGTFVRISGRHFTAGTAVRFGGVLASDIQITSENALTCTTPPGTGTVDLSVTNLNGTAVLARAFTYIAAPPAGTQLDWFPPEAPEDSSEGAGEDLPPPRDLKATRVSAPGSSIAETVSAPGIIVAEEAPRLLSYNVYRSTDPDFAVSDESARLIAVIPAGVTEYFDPDLATMSGEVNIDPTYFYRVTAIYEQGESIQTNTATTGITITGASLETVGEELTLVLRGVSFSTFRAQIQVNGVKLRQTRFPELFRLGNGTSTRIEGVDNLNLLIAPGQTVSIVVVNPGDNEDLSDAQYSPPFSFRRAP